MYLPAAAQTQTKELTGSGQCSLLLATFDCGIKQPRNVGVVHTRFKEAPRGDTFGVKTETLVDAGP